MQVFPPAIMNIGRSGKYPRQSASQAQHTYNRAKGHGQERQVGTLKIIWQEQIHAKDRSDERSQRHAQ